MPIYAYRCESCGHAKDVLQKVSDPQLSTCPACGAESFRKQLTAAGFQLKGSGWYVTDFRNGNSGGAAKKDAASDAKPDTAADTKTDAAKPDTPKSDPTPSATGGGGGNAPSGGGGPSCAAQ